jgi:hypothetical protein
VALCALTTTQVATPITARVAKLAMLAPAIKTIMKTNSAAIPNAIDIKLFQRALIVFLLYIVIVD